jgi:hypothetical protein
MSKVVSPLRRRSFLRTAALATATALLALGCVAMPASASHVTASMSVSVASSARLVNGVYLAVPVDVSCPVLEAPYNAIFSDDVSVSVTQKAGTDFAFGYGSVGYQSPIFNGVTFGTPVTCDGSPHTYTISVFPVLTDSAPFHGGRAVASASFTLNLYDPLNPSFSNIDQNFTSGGSQSVTVRGGG